MSEPMVFRGFCKHGKVRFLMTEPTLKDTVGRVREFKRDLRNMKARMHTTDYVDIDTARKSDCRCDECRNERGEA